MDTGPVLARREEAIRPEDDAGLARRAARGDRRRRGRGGAASSRGRHRDADAAGRHAPRGRRSSGPPTGSSTGRDPRTPSCVVCARSRPTRARTPRSGGPTSSCSARRRRGRDDGAAGTIVGVDRAGVVVATGDGGVRLLEVAAPGRRRMPAARLGARRSRSRPAIGSGRDHGPVGGGRDRPPRHRRGRVLHPRPARARSNGRGWTRATGASRPSSRSGRSATFPAWIARSGSGPRGRWRA